MQPPSSSNPSASNRRPAWLSSLKFFWIIAIITLPILTTYTVLLSLFFHPLPPTVSLTSLSFVKQNSTTKPDIWTIKFQISNPNHYTSLYIENPKFGYITDYTCPHPRFLSDVLLLPPYILRAQQVMNVNYTLSLGVYGVEKNPSLFGPVRGVHVWMIRMDVGIQSSVGFGFGFGNSYVIKLKGISGYLRVWCRGVDLVVGYWDGASSGKMIGDGGVMPRACIVELDI